MADALEARGEFAVEALSKIVSARMISTSIEEAGRASERTRLLPASLTLWIVMLLMVFRRLSYENLLERLGGGWLLSQRWKEPPTTTAFTKARDRLGVDPLRRLFRLTSGQWSTESSQFRISLDGRRVFAIDGATLKVPDTAANRAHFGLPGQRRGRTGYPQMRAVTLLDVGPRLVVAERHGPYKTGEVTLARDLLNDLSVGSIVVHDRGFLGYDYLWAVHEKTCEFIVRAKKKLRRRVVEVRGPGDCIVEADIPRRVRRKNPNLPKAWRLREVTFCPKGHRKDVTVWTTILSASVSASDLAACYCSRWEIETVHDEWKTHQCACTTVNRPVVFRSETPERVEQEWFALLLAYNAVRKVMCDAAAQAGVEPHRLSFTGALERMREAVQDMSRMRAAELLPWRYRQLLASIAKAVVPDRAGRRNPRVVKVKMSKYRVKQHLAT